MVNCWKSLEIQSMINDETQNDEADDIVGITRGQAAVTLASPCICLDYLH